MEYSEMETIIVLNDADLREGFFRLSTSKEKTFNRVLRRIGGEANCIDLRLCQRDGKTTEWILKIPSRYYSTSTMGIRAPAQKRPLSDEHKAKLLKGRTQGEKHA